MIKRPLVWMLSAYLFGMFLAWQSISFLFVISSMSLIGFVIYLLMYRIRKKLINRKDNFLWGLPLLILFGFYAMGGQMKLPELYQAFEEEAHCELTGTVTMIVKKQWGKALYVKNIVVSLSRGDPYFCENVIVLCSDNQYKKNNQSNSEDINYLVGNQITVSGTILKFSKASNPGQFNEQMYYQIENIDFKVKADQIVIVDSRYSKFHVFLGEIKDKLIAVYDTLLSNKESGALIAMLLGEKYLLEEEIKQLYQENGISHVLAISGLHISLIGMSVFQLLKKLKLPMVCATFFSIFFIYSYGVLTNFSVSTNRAIVMMIVMLLSSIFGKTYDMLSATALSALLILLQNPLQIFHAGFLLSFGAVLGIAILLPCLQLLFPSKNAIMKGLFVSVTAQAVTLPMVLFFYYQFPIYSVLTNLIILPGVTFLMLTSILAGMVGLISIQLGVFLIGGANYILIFYEWICRVGSHMPGNLITVGKPDGLRILLYYILLFLFIWGTRRYGRKRSIIILVVAIVILFIPQRNVGLEITLLDVGQGEAIFMETESGSTYFIDGGSSDINQVGKYRLQPFLMSEGVGKLDYAIITHSDMDHISGLRELIEQGQIAIKHLILPKIESKEEAYVELEALAKEKEIIIQYIEAGDIIQDGDIKMICLHPEHDYQAPSSNAYSTVLSITYGEFDMLLTGDLEQDGEKLLLELFQDPRIGDKYAIEPAIDYDVLKVAHHGSKNSTCEDFLNVVQPEYALISCGKDNKKVTRLIQFRFTCSALKWLNTRVLVASCQEIVLDLWGDIRLHTSDWNRVCCFCTTALTI